MKPLIFASLLLNLICLGGLGFLYLQQDQINTQTNNRFQALSDAVEKSTNYTTNVYNSSEKLIDWANKVSTISGDILFQH